MKKKLILILPSLSSGGMERVMTQLAYHFVDLPKFEVNMLIMTRNEKFYDLPARVKIYEPDFDYRQYNKLFYSFKTLLFIRKILRELRPDVGLSFGGKYNAFVLVAGFGVNIRLYISERSQPNISYGRFLDLINPWAYRLAAGIIAQTNKAKEACLRQTNHKKISVIPNPIRMISCQERNRKPIIINVGRFISTKHQDWLIDYFDQLKPAGWKLCFLGDGPKIEIVKDYAKSKSTSGNMIFAGNVVEIDRYYMQASIFAFTSTSEGFPNALGEAMAAGCACISFDCDAGPSELIDDGVNGFLIAEGDHKQYKQKLQLLIEDPILRQQFSVNAREKIQLFSLEKIGNRYLDFMFFES